MSSDKQGFKKTEIGLIPENWEIKKVREIGIVKTGKTPPTNKKEYYGNDFLFIKIPDMGTSVYIKTSEIMLSKKGSIYMERLMIPKDSVIVSCIATIGKVGITIKNSFTNQQINSIIPNKNIIESKYLFYFFKNNINYLESRGGGGSVYTNISKSKFENLCIVSPSLPEQKAIAKVLSDLDEKIELNNEMNKTLEEIGQALFKRWFIDFEFPDENGNPYRSSGGEMVFSEELGKEIPKGWEVGKLGEYISLQKGLSYKGNGLCNREEGLPMINLGTMAPHNGFIYGGLKYYKGEYKERNLVFPGEIVIANTDITQKREVLGSPAIVPYDLDNHKILFTHHIFAVRNKSILPNMFIYYILQTSKYKERSSTYATGTTVLALPQDAVLDLFICIPSPTILDLFVKHVLSNSSKINSNIEESRHLSELRDSLLPKLMSGEIRVPLEASQ